ncbi:MAG: hypothetical protein PVJ60_02255 [Phycisphaerales bacterium]|jgi:hypothetical protein
MTKLVQIKLIISLPFLAGYGLALFLVRKYANGIWFWALTCLCLAAVGLTIMEIWRNRKADAGRVDPSKADTYNPKIKE